MTVARELLGAAELLQLRVAADEPRQPAAGACLKTGPRRARPRHLVNLHRVASPLTGTGPSALTATKSSTSSRVDAVSRMLPGLASCSIRPARWVVWPTAV